MRTQTRRILIVEDEVILALDFGDTVEQLGYEVIGPALSLDEGLHLALHEKIDCALLDVNLGRGITSQPIAEALRTKGVKLAFVTAYTREQVDFALPGEVIMHKPPEPAMLQRVLDGLCD